MSYVNRTYIKLLITIVYETFMFLHQKPTCTDSQTVCLTIRPWEHEATGLTAHKHTCIHVLSYGGPKKMAAIPEVFALLWEKTGELSDGCFIQALV